MAMTLQGWRVVIGLTAAVVLSSCDVVRGLGGLEPNRVRIEGTWYRLSGGFPDSDTKYEFDDGIIERNDIGWASYTFLGYSQLQVQVGEAEPKVYKIEFPNDTSMIWSCEVKGKMTTVRWARPRE
jgi:hypothetical protein